MENLVLYIHGKGGNSLEAEHYKNLFSYYDVKGLDYKSNTCGILLRKSIT